MKFLTLSIIFTSLIATCLFSTTINVPADQPTIQAGIDAAVDGDTVLVAEEIYYENINFNGKAITVASNFIIDGDEAHIENTVINGSQAVNPSFGSCVIFNSGEDNTAILTGFTLTGGTGTFDSSVGYCGGGIVCMSSSPKIVSNIITYNIADYCGGVSCYPNASPILLNNEISYNTAETTSVGGIEIYDNSDAVVIGNIIKNNTAQYRTGGVLILNSSPTFINNIISDNIAFDDNVGGIAIQDCDADIINCLINNNACAGYGGGILLANADSRIINCTIFDNTSYTDGGGINNGLGSQSNIINCILWDNSPQQIRVSSGSTIVEYSDIEGGWPGIDNIDEEPLFIDSGDHPFMLENISPCINAGKPDTTGFNLPEFDLAENPRIFDDRIDIGAYENQNPESSDECLIPITLRLEQNYPNPFNPITEISYQLSEFGEVSLKIYNIKAQYVKTLVNEFQSSGEHSVIWNGTDKSNHDVPSGVYFYRLKTKDDSKIKKMILLK